MWTKLVMVALSIVAIIAGVGYEIVTVGDVFIVAVLLTVIAVLAVVIILLLNNLEAYFIEVPKGATTFINAGENLKEIWPNIGGHKMSDVEDIEGRRWLVSSNSENDWINAFFHNSNPRTIWFQKWLWNRLGVRFISIFWPQVHRHAFDIRSRKRLLEGADVDTGASLKTRVVDTKGPEDTASSTVVKSLLFLVPRPVYLEGIELGGDNSKINLLLQPIYQQVIPTLPVYYFKGDFFTQLDAVVESVVVDFCATHRVTVKDDKGKDKEEPLTYAHWLKLAKTGDESLLGQRLYEINATKSYRNELDAKPERKKLVEHLDKVTKSKLAEKTSDDVKKIAPSGIIQRFGFALVSFRLIGWEPHDDTKDLAKALLAKETQAHTADGVRQKAYGERDAKVANATGDSSLVTQVMTALKAHDVDANVAAGVLGTMVRTKNIGDSNITTYVEGGASATVMVPASAPATPVTPTSTTTTP